VSPWVVSAVVAITKLEGEEYGLYLIRVKANDLARRVKIADILYNLRPEEVYHLGAQSHVRVRLTCRSTPAM
jgi:GDP-D-mannose dehydratase